MCRVLLTTSLTLAALPALACVFVPKYDVSEAYARSLALGAPEVASRPIRSVEAYGHGEPEHVIIDFESHGKSADGASLFYRLSCRLEDRVQTCQSPVQLRGISIGSPIDHVEITGSLGPLLAAQVLGFVQRSLVLNDGRYRAEEYGTSRIFDGPLNILTIEEAEGFYMMKAESSDGCSLHSIKVRRVPCGLDACDFEIIESKVIHFAGRAPNNRIQSDALARA